MLKVGIVGLGTVGSSVVEILEQNKDIIKARAGKEIIVKKAVVRDIKKHKNKNIEISTNINDILDDDEIDIVVELIGGVDTAYDIVKKALEKGKNVVTANKALLAYYRYELQEITKDSILEYEASVAGGIPIINALRQGLSANHINSIKGIINGTCNYILTKMKQGYNYKDVLKEAQDLGYAEADPTFDVGGFDAGHKLLILASIAYGIDAKPEDILIEGIENISISDMEFAKEFNYDIKLLAIAKKINNQVELRVHPTLIPNTEMIAKIDGVMNGISVIGDKVGETLYYGAGAGGDATASAVVADIINIARNLNSPMLGYKKPLEDNLTLIDINDIITRYYLRLEVEDKAGILAKISEVFKKYNISIESMLQKPLENRANLFLSTHQTQEQNIKKAIKEIENFDFVYSKINMIRIEKN